MMLHSSHCPTIGGSGVCYQCGAGATTLEETPPMTTTTIGHSTLAAGGDFIIELAALSARTGNVDLAKRLARRLLVDLELGILEAGYNDPAGALDRLLVSEIVNGSTFPEAPGHALDRLIIRPGLRDTVAEAACRCGWTITAHGTDDTAAADLAGDALTDHLEEARS